MQEDGGVEQTDVTPVPDEAAEDFAAGGEEDVESIDNVVKLSDREQCARNFAIRRAIEQRMEQKALDHDLDYLGCDLDD